MKKLTGCLVALSLAFSLAGCMKESNDHLASIDKSSERLANQMEALTAQVGVLTTEVTILVRQMIILTEELASVRNLDTIDKYLAEIALHLRDLKVAGMDIMKIAMEQLFPEASKPEIPPDLDGDFNKLTQIEKTKVQ